jgi:hypothetical protein
MRRHMNEQTFVLPTNTNKTFLFQKNYLLYALAPLSVSLR